MTQDLKSTVQSHWDWFASGKLNIRIAHARNSNVGEQIIGRMYICYRYKNTTSHLFIRTYAEEENCEAIFRRSGSEFIILRMHL
jgi:hypothetical protein